VTRRQVTVKRCFDLALSAIGLTLLWPVILVTWRLAARDTGASGFFVQERIGLDGRRFRLVKLRTMRDVGGSTVKTRDDVRVTALGRRLRRWKIDELPQLWNVLKGDMSFVGPRPDVPGFADQLQGNDKVLLTVRPGITGPATLKYRDEEALLSGVADPEEYNRTLIWPDKVRLNRAYIENWSFIKDLGLILRTLRG